MGKKVLLCKPNGFCAGVDRAIQIVDLALETYGAPLYVNHEIVHNAYVCDDLRAKGAIFVDDLDEVPVGARLIYSAHGVPPQLRQQAKDRELIELDATCPLVTKVHHEAIRYARKGYHIFLIGHADHVEVIGTYGEAPESITIVEPLRGEALCRQIREIPEPPTDQLIYLTQTTLNVDDCRHVAEVLKERFPTLCEPPTDDICYATTNRQAAVKGVSRKSDFVIVVGSQTSSNSKRLVEVARESGAASELFPDAGGIDAETIKGFKTIGVTAGASTPAVLVDGVLEKLRDLGFEDQREYHYINETVHFALPYELRRDRELRGLAV